MLVVAASLFVVALTSTRSSSPLGPPSTSTTVTTSPQVFAVRSTPLRITIAALHLSARVVGLGLNADGTVQVPSTDTVTGWYRLGPAPGQQGSSVILGHVDSYRGPGVFFHLHELRPGNRIDVTLANGDKETFSVTAVREYPKVSFPSTLVYGQHGKSELQLVTCGGVFNSATGSYESNIVVFSTHVSSTATP